MAALEASNDAGRRHRSVTKRICTCDKKTH